MAQYSIKEVENLSGVKAHTLRIWEQRYDILKPHRTDTNIRYYTDEQLRLLLNIGTLNRNGLKISKIAELSEAELNEAVAKIHETTGQTDLLIDALIQSMIHFDEKRFEKTIASAILKMGFEEAFDKLIFPFMNRTGVLWVTGAINVAHEHFISHLIRRKIKVAIDAQLVETNPKTKKFILFLPEGETHELLLLFTEYILRAHHHQVLYLGSSLPVNDLKEITRSFEPDYLLTYLTVPMADISIPSFLQKLSADFPGLQILVGGAQATLAKEELPANCHLVNCEEQLLAAIG